MANLTNVTAEKLMLMYQKSGPDEAYEAFNELYKRYGTRVYHFLNKKTKSAVESDDLLQKVFMKMHESKHLYKEQYKFEQWIFVIARTSVLDHFRSSKRLTDRLEKVSKESSRDLEKEMKSETDLFFKDLDADQMELLEMKYVDELSYQEIAQVLNKSETSLRKTVSRLMGKLKKGDV